MLRKKRALSLLEIIIALALTAILVSVLFSFYRQSSVISLQLEQAKQKILSQEMFQERMAQVFNQVHLEAEKGDLPLYTSFFGDADGAVLNVSYDNGVDHQPEFCDTIKGMLYLNHKKEICFLMKSKENLSRTEVFFDGVNELKFHFFDLEEKEWTSLWPKEKKTLPAMIKMSLYLKSKKKEPFEFVCFLTSKKQEITYK
jgi:hypothetical protein